MPSATPNEVVDAIERVFGEHRARRVHAKGIALQGQFIPSPDASSVCAAPHMQRSTVPVVVRFSNFTGVPDASDLLPGENPRGMAVKFLLPDGGATDIVAHAYDGFPVATTDDLRELFLVIAASRGAQPPTALDRFFATHASARPFFEHRRPPASYATLRYHGVNAFRFTSATGGVTHGRYQLLPDAGEHLLDPEEQRLTGADYLGRELVGRLFRRPVSYRLVLQVADPIDRLDDASVAWPATRALRELGHLTLPALVADVEAAERELRFRPGALTAGIEPADPMIGGRDAVYGVSGDRRGAP
jgi:catalase